MKNKKIIFLASIAILGYKNAIANFYYGASIIGEKASYNKNNVNPTVRNISFVIKKGAISGETFITGENGLGKDTEYFTLLNQIYAHQGGGEAFHYLLDGMGANNINTSLFEDKQEYYGNLFAEYKNGFGKFVLDFNDYKSSYYDENKKLEERWNADRPTFISSIINSGKMVKIGDYYYVNYGKSKGAITEKDFINADIEGKDKMTEWCKINGGEEACIDVLNVINGKGKLYKDLSDLQREFASVEHENIENSANATNLRGSVFAGYQLSKSDFNVALELGLDFITSKVGKNSENQLELKNDFSLNLIGRLGYSFTKNTNSYINLGFGMANYKVKYEGLSVIDIDERKILQNLIVGVGAEVFTTKKLRIFSEINHSLSLNKIQTSAGEVKVETTALKVGFRYLF